MKNTKTWSILLRQSIFLRETYSILLWSSEHLSYLHPNNFIHKHNYVSDVLGNALLSMHVLWYHILEFSLKVLCVA